MVEIVTFFWGKLSRLEWVCLNSFIRHGFNVSVYTCGDLKVPDGVKIRDAGSYIDCDNIILYGQGAKSGAGSPSLISNIFRYKILATGNNMCWVDTDMMCLKKFSVDDLYLFGVERGKIINSAILGVGKSGDIYKLYSDLVNYVMHPFALDRYDHPKVFLKKLKGVLTGKTSWEHVPWGITGPQAVTNRVHKFKLQHFAKPEQYFYPISYANARQSFLPMSTNAYERKFSESYTLHLWNETLRSNMVNKNQLFHPESPFERIVSASKLDEGWSLNR